MDNSQLVREGVRRAYSAAALNPLDKHPFPVGRRFAQSVGYPKNLLDKLPSLSVDTFSGVSNVSIFAEIPTEATVLDLGCGAGLDSLIAAKQVGPQGKVIGLDFSGAMLARSRKAVEEAAIDNVVFCQASAENLPVQEGTIDVVLVNGIFNLNPARDAIFRELARVLRTGGTVFGAELILREPLPQDLRIDEKNWFA